MGERHLDLPINHHQSMHKSVMIKALVREEFELIG